jgi:threonine dehydrogenase-like Zn-dependent dehydrogenase
MRSARCSITLGPGDSVRIVSEREQPLPPDGIRVAPRWCGVCGTDLDIVRRSRGDRPSVLGHEAFVHLVEKGEHSDWPGDMSSGGAINPVSSTDQNRNVGHSLPGIWSTSRIMTSDEIRDGHLIEWTAQSFGSELALAEPLAAVLYADELIGSLSSEQKVLLVGSGSFAALAALYFLRLGLNCTIAGSTRKRLDELERSFGHAKFATAERRQPLKYQRFDAVLVAVPRDAAEAAIDFAFAHVRNGGVVDLVGAPAGRHIHLEGVRRANTCGSPAMDVRRHVLGPNGSARVTGHRGTGARHILGAAALLQQCPTFWQKAVTHILPLEDAPAVITSLAQNRASMIDGRGVGKAIIDMSIDFRRDSNH